MAEQKKRKISLKNAALVGLAAVLSAGVIRGTYAYLTDSENTTNVFTIGKVQIDEKEPNYPGNGSGKVTDIVPGENVPKDPTVVNTGNNTAVIFASVDIPMEPSILYTERANAGAQDVDYRDINKSKQAVPLTNHEIFRTISAADMENPDVVNGKVELSDGTGDSGINPEWKAIKHVYVMADGSVKPGRKLNDDGSFAVQNQT